MARRGSRSYIDRMALDTMREIDDLARDVAALFAGDRPEIVSLVLRRAAGIVDGRIGEPPSKRRRAFGREAHRTVDASKVKDP